MKTIKNKSELIDFIASERNKDKSIGFVPTMGALHEGHLSLIHRAKSENDLVVCSIFVNPTQFNNKADLEKYPRTLDLDIQLLSNANCDVLFAPELEEMYKANEQSVYEPGSISTMLEGEFRPGHFKGVAQIVSKLFQLVQPSNAYFGIKDYQQLLVIRQMVVDLNLKICIVACPILREENGLAMSSRNERLNSEDREAAKIIYESLLLINLNAKSNKHCKTIIDTAIQHLKKNTKIQIEYLKIVDSETLLPLETLNKRESAIAVIAVNFGGVRLIDNLYILESTK